MVQVEKYRNLFKRYMPVQNKVCNIYVYIRKDRNSLPRIQNPTDKWTKIWPYHCNHRGSRGTPSCSPPGSSYTSRAAFSKGGNPSSCSEKGIFF